MHFCEECGNMYYIKISEDTNSLNYYCRKCGNENKELINGDESICVSKTEIKKGSNSYKHIINKYTNMILPFLGLIIFNVLMLLVLLI